MSEIMLIVHGHDFTAAAVFDGPQHMVCVQAAPKLAALLHMDLAKAERRCKMLGWRTEMRPIVTTVSPVAAVAIDGKVVPPDQARQRLALGQKLPYK